MSFNQVEYISKFNKNNYKMYQFRVKKNDKELIDYLDKKENRNNYILSLINDDINKKVYSLKEIKRIIKPILNKYGISDIYLFGSYAREEAKSNSDIDIYCDKGNIKTLIDQGELEEELENALNKEVDIIFTTSILDEYFKKQIKEDMIKLC
jgi:predicted nucleotidyltransferase